MKVIIRFFALIALPFLVLGCMTHSWVTEPKPHQAVGATYVDRPEAIKSMRSILIYNIETGSSPEELGPVLQTELMESFQQRFSGVPEFRPAAARMAGRLPVDPFAAKDFWQSIASKHDANGILFIKNQRYFEPGKGDRFEEWAIGFGSGVAQSNWRVSVFDGRTGELVWDREYIIGDSPVFSAGATSTSNRNALKRFAQELASQWPKAVR